MTITLTPDQEASLSARVAARALLDERLAERAIEDDDFAWAKPFLDEAEADIAQGDTITLEEHRARNAARLAALRD